MEREILKIYGQMLTGLLLMVLFNVGFWHVTDILGFIVTLGFLVTGFFLSTSKALVLRELGYMKNPVFLATLFIFIFLFVSFLPVWCHELVNVVEGWRMCAYMNFWEYNLYNI